MRALDKKQASWLELWDANAVLIPWVEIYNALQTGIADGYVNPAFVSIMFKHTEVLKYLTDVKTAPSLRVTICSEDWYQGLSAKDWLWLMQAHLKPMQRSKNGQKRLKQADWTHLEMSVCRSMSTPLRSRPSLLS